VPKTGGNTFRGSFYTAGVSKGMVGDNYTDELKAAGLTVPGQLLKLWDFSIGVGGPVMKDRVWFYAIAREEGAHRSVPGMWANKNAGDATKFTYEPDLTRQSRSAGSYGIASLRLTFQASQRNKVGLFWDEQKPCSGSTWSEGEDGCRNQPSSGFIYGGTPTFSPEAGGTGAGGTSGGYSHGIQRVQQITWSSPVSSRFLVEAGFGTYLSRYGSMEQPGNPTRNMVRITEQCAAGCPINANIPNLTYGSQNWENNWMGAHTWRASASYVTGSHNMKFGYQGAHHVYDPKTFTNDQFLSYRVNNGIPNQLTQTLIPFDRRDRVRYAAFYGQEQWTRGRMTLQGALRYDRAWSYFPEQRVGPTRFLTTGIVFPQTEGVTGFNDVTPRLGLAYDIFGTGKTSLKVNVGKYLEAASALGIYSAANPVTRISTSASRTWTDNGNFVPDCDLLNPAAQDLRAQGGDLCAALGDQNFGRNVFSNSIDPDVLGGWGVRSGDWQIGASIQHEVLPRMSVEVGYFRRWLQNFTVNDNLVATAANFDPFNVTAPADSRLPGGGGYVVSDLYNVTPSLFGQTNNFLTDTANFGEQYQRYNGVLINVTARLRNGLTLQGGLNTGKTVTDNCQVRADLPEISPVNPYCHNDPGLITRVSGLGTYTVPKVDVLVSGTFRSDQGLPLAANYAVPSAVVAQSLGRPPSGNVPNVTVNLIEPGAQWGDRVNEFDLRVAKILRFGRTRTNLGFDVYNLFNSSAVLTYNQTFIPGGSWLTPLTVLTPRFVKISAQVDF
jgi:hypothetical protein